jgi:HK97 family phage prohead protease
MGYAAANQQMGMQVRDVWSTAYINDLPDSAFLYINPDEATGKDSDGKTVPRSARYFPVRDANGKPDAAHINAAMSYMSRAGLPPDVRARLMNKAKAMAGAHPDIGSGPMMGYEGSAGSGRSRDAIPGGLMGMQYRSFDLAVVEVRSDGDGRTLVGRAVPYGQTIDIGGHNRERFVLGAFARQIAAARGGGGFGGVKLYNSHHAREIHELASGKTVDLSEQMDGLHGTWTLFSTPNGDAALTHIREGDMLGLSVGFKAVDGGTRRGADGALERHSVHLDHVALTDAPAYPGAAVTAVRSTGHPVAGYRTNLLQARSLLDRVLTGG